MEKKEKKEKRKGKERKGKERKGKERKKKKKLNRIVPELVPVPCGAVPACSHQATLPS